jgi:hypothetical protein
MGQHDAARLNGGNFTLDGGFWSMVALQTPGAPHLALERAGVGVRVFWPKTATGFYLEQSPVITGSWSTVSLPSATNNADISVTVSVPVTNRFYRLRSP